MRNGDRRLLRNMKMDDEIAGGKKMETYRFIDEKGTFALENPENYSYLYFPVAGEQGIKSAVTPNLGGDAKWDQNTFLLEPVSAGESAQ